MSLELARDRPGRGPFALVRARSRIDIRPRVALFAALFVVALLPVLVTPIPAMVDYTNHLARMYLLTSLAASSGSPFYHLAPAFYPNLAMDLVVPRLAPILGVELGTRLFLLVAQVLLVTGAVAIELAVKSRFRISGFCALLVLYSVPFAWGFLNFEFALAVALWGIAAWLSLSRRGLMTRGAVHAVFVGALLVSHLFALGLYGVALGVHELWAARTRPRGATLAAMAVLAAPAVVAAGWMAALGAPVGQAVNTWDLIFKPLWPFILLNGYSAIGSILGTTILLLLLHALIERRAIKFIDSGAWLACGFAALYVATPARLLDTAFVDIRVIVAAALIVPAFVEIDFPSARLRRVAVGIVAGLVIASAGLTTAVWASYQADYGALIASFARLNKGARILVGGSGAAKDPPILDLTRYPMYHAPTLAVHYADAFVPTLFTTAGKQPIAVDAASRRLAYSCGGPVPLGVLAAIAQGRPPADAPDFARAWPRDFDYLYVVGDAVANPLPDLLETMQVERRFTLYRIRRAHRASTPSR